MVATLQLQADKLIDKLWSLKQNAVWTIRAAAIMEALDGEAYKHFLQASKEEATKIVQDTWYRDGPHYQPGTWLHDLWHDEVQGHYIITPTGDYIGPNNPYVNSQTCGCQQRPRVTSTHQQCCCGGHNTSSTSMYTSADKSRPTTTNRPDALFICPITQELMNDPVLAADGIFYEREAIQEWLHKHHTSPMTNLPLPHKLLIPSYGLRSSIHEYRTANGLYSD